MFGEIEPPFRYNSDANSITLKKFKGGLIYHRVSGEDEVKKRIYSKKAKILLSPVKPFNCPKMITTNLMIELGRSLLIPPKQVKVVYVRFPIEIALIATRGDKYKVIDVFTDNPPRYALYGDIKDGMVCRYYRSDVHVRPPKTNMTLEGYFEVHVRNSTSQWREISRLVFQGTKMNIFYTDKGISGRARARIIDDEKVDTRFNAEPWLKGQKKAHDLLTPKIFDRLSSKFTMEGGY